MKSLLKKSIISLTVPVLILLAGSSSTADESFSISKNLNVENRYPSVAVDSKTGNVLVVWVRKDDNDPSNSKIYMSLCKKAASGKYKATKARLISGPDDVCDRYSGAAYNPDDNSFLAVWSALRYDSKLKTADYGIWSRKISAAGKPSPNVNHVAADNGQSRLHHPVITYSSKIPSATASVSSGYIVAFANINPGEEGLWTTFLDSDGTVVTTPKRTSKGYVGSVNYPTDMIIADNGSFIIGHVKNDPKLGNVPYAAKLSSAGQMVKERRIGSVETFDIRIAQLSKSLFIAALEDAKQEYIFRNQLFTSSMKPKGKPFDPQNEDDARDCAFVKLDGFNGVLQLRTGDRNHLYYQLIDAEGRYAGNAVLLFETVSALAELDAVNLPGSSRVFIAYAVQYAENFVEMRGISFDPLEENE